MDSLALHSAIQKVCPIIGVSIGDTGDKSTWRVDFAPNATADQKAAAEAAISAYDTLADVKSVLSSRVDADAERVRLRYITPGVGQSMTYLEKHNQAIAVEAMGQQAANALSEQDRTAQFPTLAASVGIEAATLWDCAQIVVQTYEAWAALSNQIERTRLMGKRSISLASDAAAAQAAYEAITWPQ